jgi:CxC2 like cysteine cluster associated with KDZ transposases
MRHQDSYLALLLSHESLPHGPRPCTCGSDSPAIFVCDNCHGRSSLCERCTIGIHRGTPFHRVKRWNGRFMEETALSKLGLTLYFGHEGSACPVATMRTLSALHIDGFHSLSVAFCTCESSPPFHLQLFNNKLFSASIDSPNTVFTFELLRHFRIHHLESKGSPFSYIHSLYRLTNDEGSPEIPV